MRGGITAIGERCESALEPPHSRGFHADHAASCSLRQNAAGHPSVAYN